MQMKNSRKSNDITHNQSSIIDEGHKTKPTENTYLQSEQENDNSKDISRRLSNSNMNNNDKIKNNLVVQRRGKICTVYTEISPNKKQQLSQIQSAYTTQNAQKGSFLPNINHKSITSLHRQSQASVNFSGQRSSVVHQSLGNLQKLNQDYNNQMPNIRKQQGQKIDIKEKQKSFFLTSQPIEEHGEQQNQFRRTDGITEIQNSSRVQSNRYTINDELQFQKSNSSQQINDSVIKPERTNREIKEINPYVKRKRDFVCKVLASNNLFEGLPFVQFENFIRRDKYMQKNIIRDLLKILGDKCHNFKSVLFDRRKLRETYKTLDTYAKKGLNKNIEQIIGLLETIVLLLLQDFTEKDLDDYNPRKAKDDHQQLRQSQYSKHDQEEEQVKTIMEQAHFQQNLYDILENLGLQKSPLQEYREQYEEYNNDPVAYKQKIRLQKQETLLQIQQQQQLKNQQKQQNQDGNGGVKEKKKKKGKHNNNNADSIANIQLEQLSQDDQNLIDEQNDINLLSKKKEQIIIKPILEKIEDEDIVIIDNANLFDKMADFVRDTIDAFRMLSRQRDYKQRGETQCYLLLKYITQVRYQMGEVQESIRSYEKNKDDYIKWEKQQNNRNNIKKDSIIDEEQLIKEEHQKRRQRIQILLQNKFNFQKKNFQTRESKVTLNDAKFEQEKQLLQEMNSDQSDQPHVIADNRKKVAIERLKNPFKDPEIAYAIKIARQSPNLNIPKQLFQN